MSFPANGLLFDNDGVLVDSHVQVMQAWSQLAGEYDLDTSKLLVELVGKRAVDTLSRYLPAEKLTTAVARLEGLELELASQTTALAGAQTLVNSLRAQDWTVVTSATAPLAQARWLGAGISLPQQSITADDVAHGKPAPEPYLAGAAVLGVDPATCIVFEDSPAGGLAGRAAGATVIAVGDQPWSFEPAARVPDLTHVRASMSDSSSAVEITISL